MKKIILSLGVALIGITAFKMTTHNNVAAANEPAKMVVADANINNINTAVNKTSGKDNITRKDNITGKDNTSPSKQTRFGTRLAFYRGVLKGIGAKVTVEKIKFLEAWRRGEGGKATNNPFNTTKDVPGTADTKYNSVGVRNYPDLQTGVAATIATLKLDHYKEIVELLKKDTVTAHELAHTSALKKWGTGDMVKKVLAGGINTKEMVAAL
jgi:hypothetical protein